MSFKDDLVPDPQVPYDEILSANAVMTRQQLSVYQRLYKEGLANPGERARPLTVRRSETHTACIEVYPPGHEEWGFLVLPAENPDAAVPKARLLVDAIGLGQQKVHAKACCPCAKIEPCVCVVSFSCPIHGVTCHGSHD